MVQEKIADILIVDDEIDSLTVLRDLASSWGFNVEACSSAASALEALRGRNFDIVLTDLMMPETDGIELLKSAMKIDPLIMGIIVTGQGTIQTAVDAMKTGAFDFVLKPIEWKNLRHILGRAADVRRLRDSEAKYRLLAEDQAELIRCFKKAEEEKTRLEAQLVHAQKMEAVGTLAGGVAHDFNNILTAIIGYVNIILMKMEKGDPLRSYLDRILDSSERAAGLVRSLLAFSRKQIINPKPLDINSVVRNTEHLLTTFIGEDIEIRTVPAAGELVVLADAGHIEQVLINLATNARDAMPDIGVFSIEVSRTILNEDFYEKHGYGEPGEYALITVKDTGEGMDENTRDRIFEPFFTTKAAGKGTGLGLAMVYGIIKQHGGYITCSSLKGKGTTFDLYLPLVNAGAESEEPFTPWDMKGGTETILLAEDNPDVRRAAKEVLTEAGYKVIEASDGEEAISRFTQHRNDVELLIVDVIMPRKNGREVFDEIRLLRPDINVLFVSGYTADIIGRKGVLEENLDFISKPFPMHAFLEKVREMLDRSQRSAGATLSS
jgi:signal transduction histidine kinase